MKNNDTLHLFIFSAENSLSLIREDIYLLTNDIETLMDQYTIIARMTLRLSDMLPDNGIAEISFPLVNGSDITIEYY
jgi:hypothetical protein